MENGAKIKVLGVGGAGSNIVNYINSLGIEGVELVAINTDFQHLSHLEVKNKVQIGERLTQGRGVGGNPELGQKAAEEDIEKIKEVLKDADMAILVAGFGGGTGTGASPVIAKTCKDMGILTLCSITLPFSFEGKRKMEIARSYLEKLKDSCDSYLLIHNDRVKELRKDKKFTWKNAFRIVDETIAKIVKGTAQLIGTNAYVNVDFEDLKATLKDSGLAVIGTGEGSASSEIETIVESVINNPLLEGGSIKGAKKLLINAWMSDEVEFEVFESAIKMVQESASEEAEVIYGIIPEGEGDHLRLDVIATGFEPTHEREEEFKIIGEETFNDIREIPAYLRRQRRV